MLWIDKYRPLSLDRLDYHDNLSSQLKTLAASPELPHMLVYGPSGSGKKTRIMALLREIYGAGVEKLKIDVRNFVTPSNKKLEINIVSSKYHIEVTPSDVGAYDRIIIQDLIKEVAQTQQVDSSARRPFKIVIFNEADSISRDAQAALRRTMEKYMANLRVIMCATSTSKIIPPIRSRCLLIRVPAPDVAEICNALQKVATWEGLQLPNVLATRIATASEGNLRKALLMLESAKVNHYPFTEKQEVMKADWEIFIAEIARYIIQDQSPKRLQDVRGKLYELLAHCVSADVILKTLAFEIIGNIDPGIATEVIEIAAKYQHQMSQGTKVIFYLEAFVARFMATYKKYLMTLME